MIIACPRCQQKLMLQPTMLVGAALVCPKCDAHLRVTGRDPDKLEVVAGNAALDRNNYPESYA